MSPSDLAIVAALVFAWGPSPLFSPPPPPLPPPPTLSAGLRDLHADLGWCLRLLGIGLPLTIGLGTLLALGLFNGMSIWLALLVGAALAPTDAALGAGVMVNPAVPARIRQLLNIESGLNDGVATPVVLVAIAGAETTEHAASVGPGAAVAELALGLLVGAVVGGAGGLVVNVARRRGWAAGGFAGSAVLALAVCAYAGALALHGNGVCLAGAGGHRQGYRACDFSDRPHRPAQRGRAWPDRRPARTPLRAASGHRCRWA